MPCSTEVRKSSAAPAEREKIRAVAIKEKSKAIIKDLIEDPRSGENIKKAVGLATQLTDCILSSREIIHELISLNSYDLYTYTHSVNVAVLSVAIGVTHGMGRARRRRVSGSAPFCTTSARAGSRRKS